MQALVLAGILALTAPAVELPKPRPFIEHDRASARILVGSVVAGARSWVRCRIVGSARVTLRCDTYTHPALANRYYRQSYVWQSATDGIFLNLTREGRLILLAKVRGVSPKSFLIERVIYHR